MYACPFLITCRVQRAPGANQQTLSKQNIQIYPSVIWKFKSSPFELILFGIRIHGMETEAGLENI